MYPGTTTEAFVNTDGDDAVGLNATADTSGDEDVTVNTVPFTGAGFGETIYAGPGMTGESITIAGTNPANNTGSFTDGEFSSNAPIFHLIRGGIFRVETVTLAGLTPGQSYLLQVFTNDARSSRNTNFIAGFGDGSGSTSPVATSELNNSPVTGSPVFPQTEAGDSIIGTFKADAATLTFNVFGTNAGPTATLNLGDSRAQINAIQLRRVPEPASLALFAFGTCGLVWSRRRA